MKYFMLFSLIWSNCFAQELSESESLKIQLNTEVTSSHRPINYKQANEILFTKLDNHNGTVCSVYSSKTCLATTTVPSPKLMNVEHTWPQSDGANGEAKSDLHHIFPAESSINSIRSSLPFCEVITLKWEKEDSKRGYSQFGEHCFEPPSKHKGVVARALFYFSIRYKKSIDKNQEFFLKKWHNEFPADQYEIDRNAAIFGFQNNLNPFVVKPELVNQISDF